MCYLHFCLSYLKKKNCDVNRVRRCTVQICIYCVNMYVGVHIVGVYIVGVYFLYVYVVYLVYRCSHSKHANCVTYFFVYLIWKKSDVISRVRTLICDVDRVKGCTVQICIYCVNMYVCVYVVGVHFVYV